MTRMDMCLLESWCKKLGGSFVDVTSAKTTPRCESRPALRGATDWWRMKWPSRPESGKHSQRPRCAGRSPELSRFVGFKL